MPKRAGMPAGMGGSTKEGYISPAPKGKGGSMSPSGRMPKDVGCIANVRTMNPPPVRKSGTGPR